VTDEDSVTIDRTVRRPAIEEIYNRAVAALDRWLMLTGTGPQLAITAGRLSIRRP
jgi:hypothetical protein